MPRKLRLARALVGKLPVSIPDPGPIEEIADLQNEDVRAGTLRTVLATRPDPDWRGYVGGLTVAETASLIAPAVGILGSMADYVLNTASHLEEMGIDDPTVWQMQDLVAVELERMP